MRILVLPIYRQHTHLACVKPSSNRGPSSSSSHISHDKPDFSSAKSARTNHGHRGNGHHGVVLSRNKKPGFFSMISPNKAKPGPEHSVTQKTAIYLSNAMVSAREQMDAMEKAPANSMKKKMHNAYMKAYERVVGPMEIFLKSVPSVESHASIIFPASIPQPQINTLFNKIFNDEMNKHFRWMLVNTCLLPVTLAAGFLPGPNVFFYWNAFRAYSHWAAWRGARRLKTLADQNKLEFIPDAELEQLTQPADREEYLLEEESVHEIAKHFEAPEVITNFQHTRKAVIKKEKLPVAVTSSSPSPSTSSSPSSPAAPAASAAATQITPSASASV